MMVSKYSFDPVMFFWKNKGHGNFQVIKGKIRVGKTYFANIEAKLLIDAGFKIISNCRYTKEAMRQYKGQLFYISTDRDLFNIYIENEGPFVVLFDDAQTYGMSSTKATSQKGKTIADLSLFLGKLSMNCIFIEHLKYIPEFIKGQSPQMVYKLTQKAVHIPKMQGDIIEKMAEVRRRCVKINIPDTAEPIPYETFMVPSFDITLPLDKLWSFLGKWEGKDHDLREGIRQWLLEYDGELVSERIKKMTWEDIWAAIRLKKPNVKPTAKLYQIIPNQIIYKNP